MCRQLKFQTLEIQNGGRPWHSETDWNIAVSISKGSMWIWLHRRKISELRSNNSVV